MKNNLETILAHYGEERDKHNGAIVPPIYQNTLFAFESWDHIDNAFSDPINNNIYTRGNNPSVSIVEKKLAKIAGGEKARLFSSGMAAISSAIMSCVKANCHVITLRNIYGPAMNFLDNYLRDKFNVDVTFVSGESVEEIENAIKENTTLIYLESPSSAIFSMQNLKAIADLAKKHNIKTIVDNTWATPIFQKPLELGIDLEVHSCSKYLGGHSDIIAGVIIGSAKDIDSIYQNEFLLFGAKMAPFEAWLLMRSLRTLPMRMERHQNNALKVASFLENHPKIKSVNYPGLKSHPQFELGKKQMNGYSGLMSFVIDSEELADIKNFVNALEHFSIGVSWGGHESLIHAPAISYLKEMSPEQFKSTGLSLGVMRVSIGLEHVDDLIDDLNKALTNIK
ncbi:PLP-dependent aspartate aminotransferase family protein [Cetobacterium somerae]|uniref:trans-sulfuration enzyme family protein n=1 Tax=Cetobacterium sp. NK01 TaxID=2993530 RepID=UPI002116F7E3|nr:PLP-dependent aspartate aminotransferase family protein [Cetobacterium sp. NK01]MCQ8212200.1 PLP-dependent aspartate aminotransferase family protein [Cetobacterium sp. NK01]